MMESYQPSIVANRSRAPCVRRYAPRVTTVDLRSFHLRPGETRREQIDVELEPFHLGGQRYDSVPSVVPVELEVSQASGATVFDIRFDAHLTGPCMRCLGFAEVEARCRGARVLRSRRATRRRAALGLRGERAARRGRMGARCARPRATRADPLPPRVRRAVPGLRQGPERRAARARRARARPAVGCARRASRSSF